MNKFIFLWFFLFPLTTVLGKTMIQETGNIPFNEDWLFYKGDLNGAETPDFDDHDWRRLNLPHDWAIEGPFDRKYNARCGGLPFHGTGWYRKHFILPAEAKNKQYSYIGRD